MKFHLLSVQSSIPQSAMGKVDGLVGYYDGNSTNDLMNKAGNIVCVLGNNTNCDDELIYREFGESCKCSILYTVICVQICMQSTIVYYK